MGGILGPVGFALRFFGRNGRALLVDAVVIAAWVGLLALAVDWARWSLLAYYAAMVGGIVVYTLVRSPLEMPGE